MGPQLPATPGHHLVDIISWPDDDNYAQAVGLGESIAKSSLTATMVAARPMTKQNRTDALQVNCKAEVGFILLELYSRKFVLRRHPAFAGCENDTGLPGRQTGRGCMGIAFHLYLSQLSPISHEF